MHQKRQLEKNILSGIDRLVHLLIEMSCSQGQQKEQLLEEAVQTVKALNPLLLVLLDGKEEHLENLLRQLISQKLPHGYALDSFGPLKGDLDTVLSLAFYPETTSAEKQEEHTAESPGNTIDKAPEPIDVPASEAASPPESEASPSVSEHRPELELAMILRRLFPTATMQQGYLYRGLYLHYYLPEKKLALLILYPEVRQFPAIERLLIKDGITLVKLQPSELQQPAFLARKLARYQT